MRFNASRNWFLIAFAVGSPYYWIQYLLANRQDQSAIMYSSAFVILSVVLLIFLLRKHYIEVAADRIVVQTPFRQKSWTPSELGQVSISDQIISVADTEGRIDHLMIPQKPKEFEALKEAIKNFCRRHKVAMTDQPFDPRMRSSSKS